MTSEVITQLTATPSYARLNQREWRGIQTSTDSQYKKLLGNPPRRSDIKKKIDNPQPITGIQYAAMLVLIVVAIFTGYKTGALAIPFSDHLIDHLSENTYISQQVRTSFNFVTFVLFWLLSTPSLIYFKLLSHDERIVKQRNDTASMTWTWGMLSLEWISPRLPTVITYMSTFWLLWISAAGTGTIFEKFLPVFVEIGLAQLVGDILEQNAAYQRIISDRLRLERDAYEERLADKKDDARVSIMSGIMLETMMNVVRDGKRPNAFLEKADKATIKSVLSTEYERLTVVDNFVAEVENKKETPTVEPVETVSSPVERVKAETPRTATTKRLKPPRGAKQWTTETMVHALKVKDADPTTYTERNVKQDFEPNYNATGVWRKGAKKAFTGKD